MKPGDPARLNGVNPGFTAQERGEPRGFTTREQGEPGVSPREQGEPGVSPHVNRVIPGFHHLKKARETTRNFA